MKRMIGVALVALVTASAFSGAAFAQCGSGMLIKFDADCFAYETNYTPATFNSAPGSLLNVVGIVSEFCAPLNDLNPADPGKEYTFLWTNLTSGGTAVTPIAGGGAQYITAYAGGNFLIYEGSPRNAPTAAGGMPPNPPNAAVPVNFVDGTLILQGTLANFKTTVTFFGITGTYATSFRSDYQFTGPVGGTYYGRLSSLGTGILGGAWCAAGSAGGLCGLPAGYSSHPNGKFDIPATDVRPSTWGAIKQLYR